MKYYFMSWLKNIIPVCVLKHLIAIIMIIMLINLIINIDIKMFFKCRCIFLNHSLQYSIICLWCKSFQIYITFLGDTKLLKNYLTAINERFISIWLFIEHRKMPNCNFFNKKNHNTYHLNDHISDNKLHRFSLLQDLGILFDSKLLFKAHILVVKNKTLVVFLYDKKKLPRFSWCMCSQMSIY